MPTEKFMNLGDYKKQAILDAMRAEFMTTPTRRSESAA